MQDDRTGQLINLDGLKEGIAALTRNKHNQDKLREMQHLQATIQDLNTGKLRRAGGKELAQFNDRMKAQGFSRAERRAMLSKRRRK